MPAFVLPQILLCGLVAPRDQMASGLTWISDAMPLTYAYDALHRVASLGELDRSVAVDTAVVVGVTLLSLGLGAITLRRRTG
jgi:ABC-2 type transport system permease protein